MSIRPLGISGPALIKTIGGPHTWGSRVLGLAALLGLAAFVAQAPLSLVILVLGGSSLGLALLSAPQLGLIALAALIPLSRLVPLPVSLPGLGAADLLLAATVAAFFARGIADRRRRQPVEAFKPGIRPFNALLLTFLWITAMTLTQAVSWREGLPEWIKWAEFGVAYLLAAGLLDRRGVRWLLAALFVAGVSQALLGAYQFLSQSGPEAFILLGRFMRAYGTFQQPNPYAGYLGYLAPVAASLALSAAGMWWRRRRPRDLTTALVLVGIAGALIAGILMSWSRGAWLGLGAALTAVAGLRSKKTAFVTVLALIVLVGATAVFGTGWLPASVEGRVADLGRYVSGPDPARTEIDDANFSVLERLAHWEAGRRMFDEHPWLGVGIGNYGIAYAKYALPHWYEPLGHAHNIFINFFAETGVLGGAAFLLLWLGIVVVAGRSIRAGGFVAALAAGVVGAWVYLSVHNLFDNLFVQHMQLQLALLLGALVALQQRPVASAAPPPFHRGSTSLMAYRATYPMTSELPPFLAWIVRLPVINRLGIAQRPRELKRFVKFAMVGAFGAVVDLTVLNIMHKVFGLHLLAANTISVSVAIISNFVWNRLWTFPESRERPLATQLGKFAIVNIIGLGINNAVFWVFTHIMANFIHDPWNYNIAKLGAIGVVLFWNFFINRFWTYRGID